jgi:hypothetical protein
MGKFFSRFKKDPPDPAVNSWTNLSQFYSLLIFLVAIPFVLIVALVWLTGVIGFSAWIFAAVAILLGLAGWRLYKRWGVIKAKMAAQGGQFQDMVREAAKSGQDVEVSLLNGLLTLRYQGRQALPALAPAPPLALPGPELLELEAACPPPLAADRLRAELAEFSRLRDDGVISPEDFERIKSGLLERLSV